MTHKYTNGFYHPVKTEVILQEESYGPTFGMQIAFPVVGEIHMQQGHYGAYGGPDNHIKMSVGPGVLLDMANTVVRNQPAADKHKFLRDMIMKMKPEERKSFIESFGHPQIENQLEKALPTEAKAKWAHGVPTITVSTPLKKFVNDYENWKDMYALPPYFDGTTDPPTTNDLF